MIDLATLAHPPQSTAERRKESQEGAAEHSPSIQDVLKFLTHDVATPFTVVMGNIELAKDVLSQEARHLPALAYEDIHQLLSEALQHAQSMVDEIRSFEALRDR